MAKTELTIRMLGTVAAIVAFAGCSGASDASDETASASDLTVGDDAQRPPFYERPSLMPSNNGDVIRSEAMTGRLEKVATATKIAATRVLYRSTSRSGAATAVSGTIIVPPQPWVGPGKRPVIGYSVGTQGIGDTCAPSRQFSSGFEYEGVFMTGLLARGYALAITDYEGLGTAGMHTYMDRVAQGHAVLDAVRAAQRIPSTGLDAESPVVLFGYSQGGGGSASAAELAATYAPELAIKGTVAGAVPAELSVLPANLDGTIWAEFLWFAIAGVSASYDIDITPLLNPAGRAFYTKISDDCVFDLGNSALKKSSDYTVDGATLAQIVEREPFRTVLAEQRIGLRKPNAPVLVTHSRLDDTIPFAVGKQMAADWCAQGATVEFSPNLSPLHLGGMLNNSAEFYGFIEARLAGLPAPSNCAH